MRRLVLVAAGLAAVSLLGPAQPSYDPWAWLLWGRELAALELSTADGPAFKPGPVAVTTALAPLGADAAPPLWLLVARAGAVLAVLLAGRLAWRLAPAARPLAAGVAATGVLLTASVAWHGAVGHVELATLALALAAADRALDGRHGAAFALAVGAALLRVEAWPFVALHAAWLWRRAPSLRPWLAAAAVAVPALWFAPELWGSGDLLRSGARAQVPNPGQPATAAVPLVASLEAALALPFWPVAVLAVAAPRGPARTLAAGAAAWIALVAIMAQAGFSGEPRYALPGAALLAVAAGTGAARLARAARARPMAGAALAGAAVAAIALLPARLAAHAGDLGRVADEAQLYATLDDAVAAAGGAAALRSCGRPATGRYRGPAVAYALGVRRTDVITPAPAGAGDVVLRSRLRRTAPVEPAATGRLLGRSARWEVRGSACRSAATRPADVRPSQ